MSTPKNSAAMALIPWLPALREICPITCIFLSDGGPAHPDAAWIAAFAGPTQPGWRDSRFPKEIEGEILQVLKNLQT